MRWRTGLVQLIKKFMYKMNKDRIKAYSAEAAFFIIMSFFPFLMLLLALVHYTPLTQEQVVQTLEGITPLGLTEELKHIVEGVYSQASVLLPWTAIAAVWSAGKGVLGLSDGLNAVFQIRETRNYIIIRIRAAFYTIGMILALLLGFGILVLGYRLQEFLRSALPFFARYSDLMLLLQLGLAMILLFLLFEIFYVFLPNRRKSFHSQVPGALFSAISWARLFLSVFGLSELRRKYVPDLRQSDYAGGGHALAVFLYVSAVFRSGDQQLSGKTGACFLLTERIVVVK